MRIGVDIRPLQGHSGFRGIGRYLENILANIPEHLKNEQFVLYAERSSKLPEDKIAHIKNQKIVWVRPKKIKKVKYVRVFARPYNRVNPSKKDVDVFFQAEAAYGISKTVPSVGVFMDVIPLLFTHEKASLKLNGVIKYKQIVAEKVQDTFYKEVLDSYKHCKGIVAISQASKDDFIKYLDKRVGERIIVTPLAVATTLDANIPEKDQVKVLKTHGLKKDGYLLYVGAIDQRKNIAGMAKDFYEVKKDFPDLKLVCVGKEFGLGKNLKLVGWTDAVNKHPEWKKDIIIPGYLSDAELVSLYKNAACFIFPSRYEGFGLPVLEAMQLGCPAICYNNSSLPEVAGDAAVMVKDGEPMAPDINKLLANTKLREQLRERGYKQAKKFSWQKTANATFEVIERAAKKN